jgi:hypothetical protein
LNKWSFLDDGRRIKKDCWFISTIAQFTQVGLQQIGLKNTTFAACQTHPPTHPLPYSPDLAPNDFYLFPTVKKFERIQLADKDQFFECL